MPKRPNHVITARKLPKQARAAELVAVILEAATRVLKREGGARFTTARVATEAGISVGSLYQYFPNKEALLFKLQSEEWQETSAVLFEALADEARPPLECLRRMVMGFFRSEQHEAELRRALDASGAPFRSTPEAARVLEEARGHLTRFVVRAVPLASSSEAAFLAEFIARSMGAAAESLTAQERPRSEIDAFAQATADMYCAYFVELDRRSRQGGA